MKKIKIEKKLSLSKETIASLTNHQMNELKGGSGPYTRHCPTSDQSNPTVCGETGGGQSQTSSVC
jgi:natural product precursor